MGFGIVGQALKHVFQGKVNLYIYDKYKTEYQGITELAKNSDIVFVSVPSPMKSSGEIDLSYVEDALKILSEEIRKIGRESIIAVIRSTIVPGSTLSLQSKFNNIKLVFNPEFLDERNFLKDMENTNRVVLGSENQIAAREVENAYKLAFPNAIYVLTDSKTAEMIKYAANASLASQVMVANEIYQICKVLGIDFQAVEDAIVLDKRLGRNVRVPGTDGDLGFGGKCLPKDLNAIMHLSENKGYSPELFKQIWKSNLNVRKNKNWLDIKGATSDRGFKSID